MLEDQLDDGDACSGEDSDDEKFSLLVDTYEGGKTLSKARKTFTTVLQKDSLHKVAILGNKPFIRAMLKFHRIVSGVDKMRIFLNKDDAIKWLKE